MKNLENLLLITIIVIGVLAAAALGAVPAGPTIQYAGNSTSGAKAGTVENNASSQGGWIITLVLDGRSQTNHWKAYVGNVTGTYILEDAANYSIYEWAITGSITGEVYATRTAGSVTWADVVCANISHVNQEMIEMNHSSTNTPGDGINDTFDDDPEDHWGFNAGPTTIAANLCNYTINPWINDSAQTADLFEEVLLYDGSSNLIYVSKIERDVVGYRNDSTTYDFQMIVAENATSGIATQTDYYFYVELS